MVAINFTPGRRFETAPAGLLQHKMGVGVVEPGQTDASNGPLRFEYMKGILLIGFMFSVLVLEIQIGVHF